MIEIEGKRPQVVTIEEIVNKGSWDSRDVEFLVEHEHLLDDETLTKLGIIEIKPLSEKEVKVETEKIKKTRATKIK